MSDLHLEVGQQYTSFCIQPCAPFLILAGDIGRLVDYDAFRDFLRVQCNQFEKVFLVLGNHEFFGCSSRTEGLLLARRLEEEEDSLRGVLSVMNRKRIDLPGLTILGCTLQSHIPDSASAIVAQKVNDFRHIGHWTIADHNAEYIKDVEWLTGEIETIHRQAAGDHPSPPQRNILVVTHHAPTTRGTSAPANEGNAWSSAFGTDLLGQGQEGSATTLDTVQWWVFGHTHYCAEFTLGHVRLVSNQRGYVFPNATPARSGGAGGGKPLTKRIRRFVGGRGEKVEVLRFDPKKVISA